jgi:hypothetical protein
MLPRIKKAAVEEEAGEQSQAREKSNGTILEK